MGARKLDHRGDLDEPCRRFVANSEKVRQDVEGAGVEPSSTMDFKSVDLGDGPCMRFFMPQVAGRGHRASA